MDQNKLKKNKNPIIVTRKLLQMTPKFWQVTRKLSFYDTTNSKITGRSLGEDRDNKTVTREPFSNDLAFMLNEWTVPLTSPPPDNMTSNGTPSLLIDYTV